MKLRLYGSGTGGQSQRSASLALSGWLRFGEGEPDLALEHVARAMRLSPLDPSMYRMHGAMAYAPFSREPI
jgi:hypothetical protein